MLLVAAWVISRQARTQAAEGMERVTEWVSQVAQEAAQEREFPPRMGNSEWVVREALAAWVRDVVPAGVAPEFQVSAESLRESMLGGDKAEATHRVRLTWQKRTLTVDVVWDGTQARAVGVVRDD